MDTTKLKGLYRVLGGFKVQALGLHEPGLTVNAS